MIDYCKNCGCKEYDGRCVNCHEEYYILEQDSDNDEHTCFSQEFMKKAAQYNDDE